MAFHQLSFNPSTLQKDGPRIFIEISASSSDIKEGSPLGLEFPPPFGITAIIDTAASLTVVNPEVVEKCKLRATGFAIVASIEKKAQYHQHAARIRFPKTKLKDFDRNSSRGLQNHATTILLSNRARYPPQLAVNL